PAIEIEEERIVVADRPDGIWIGLHEAVALRVRGADDVVEGVVARLVRVVQDLEMHALGPAPVHLDFLRRERALLEQSLSPNAPGSPGAGNQDEMPLGRSAAEGAQRRDLDGDEPQRFAWRREQPA